jgi:PqqD family protein of HPr-rel-A system
MYRLTPGQLLRRREWDDEVVLYNDLSGDTHLLSGDAIALLLVLQEGPRPAPLLADLLEAGDADALQAVLDELADLALIEFHPC